MGTQFELLCGVIAHGSGSYGPVYMKPAQYTGSA